MIRRIRTTLGLRAGVAMGAAALLCGTSLRSSLTAEPLAVLESISASAPSHTPALDVPVGPSRSGYIVASS
jgi:hypothetical protein